MTKALERLQRLAKVMKIKYPVVFAPSFPADSPYRYHLVTNDGQFALGSKAENARKKIKEFGSV